jgi:hypothetical protein
VYPSEKARELSILLRISRELDIVGDVTATVNNPSELLAWAHLLSEPTVRAWRSHSGSRYLQVTAAHHRDPLRGQVTAVLSGDEHAQFWDALDAARDLGRGKELGLTVKDLAVAWERMPLALED